MGKPSIGSAVTPAQEKEKRQIIRDLTELEIDSGDSIFSLIFAETNTGVQTNDE